MEYSILQIFCFRCTMWVQKRSESNDYVTPGYLRKDIQSVESKVKSMMLDNKNE